MGNEASTTRKLTKIEAQKITHFKRISDNFKTYAELQQGLEDAGLESSQLIIGIDFTKSNEWKGRISFEGKSLHAISMDSLNPYEQAMTYISKTLKRFDDDNLIHCYGFGDVTTSDNAVFSFFNRNQPALGLEGVLERYKQIVPHVKLSGPTSFAPIIRQAMNVVKETNFRYHILLIIADGQIERSCYTDTINAIYDASELPLSIIVVGVGDGPWDSMETFDEDLPKRKFDNIQFVNFNKIINSFPNHIYEERGAKFALQALMEIPEQYCYIKKFIDKQMINFINKNGKYLYDVPPTVQEADVLATQF